MQAEKNKRARKTSREGKEHPALPKKRKTVFKYNSVELHSVR